MVKLVPTSCSVGPCPGLHPSLHLLVPASLTPRHRGPGPRPLEARPEVSTPPVKCRRLVWEEFGVCAGKQLQPMDVALCPSV